MHELLKRFSAADTVGRICNALAGGAQTGATGVYGPARALLAASVALKLGRPVVLVPDDDHAARLLYSDLGLFAPELPRSLFNSGAHDLRQRIAGVTTVGAAVIVASAESLNQPAPVFEPNAAMAFPLAVDKPEDMARMVLWLEENKYERTDLVTEPGEYAQRGGIVDVFPEDSETPIRAEFADNTVVSLRNFDPLLQRSIGKLARAAVPTRREATRSDHPAFSLLPADLIVITEGTEIASHATLLLSDDTGTEFNAGCARPNSYLGNFELLRQELKTGGLDWFIACGTEAQRQRLSAILGPDPEYLVQTLSAGFVSESLRLGLLTERETYGTPVLHAAKRRFKGLPVDNIVALRPGDHVVHIDYGIGTFQGTRRMSHGDVEKDYIVLAYAGEDKVFVPVENIGLLDRYVGAEDKPPALDRLGGRSWLNAKAKAARASAEYAEELLKIYARRELARGTAFGPDSPWQKELEASFPHEETPDQLKVLAEVKRDMEGHRPMDRLVCGDVGYGKTEIALRAAFKAAAGLKQVALLAPTTILCYQHFSTFRKRMARFPFRIEMLSRFTSPAKQKEVVEGLKTGVVDIVIGTHVLLGARVQFRDLGLLILDEEQKFGVRQKERIRSARASVDVLTLTATPIPRTLYMSLAGLRDISQIHTPPPGRMEIATEVAPWTDSLIHDYVHREVSRGGQVFFVHNEIQSILSVAERIQRLLPGIRFAIAHGQMSGHQLADIYVDFAAGEYQVLLSTAIIESGLDMPNVNTIIVNRADRFGLSDLHQLRGRVGRSQEQAYALFLIPALREITTDARKRLSALLAFSKLGSGFKLALRDMELRGVGNLLGTEQHGQIARVGFNLYTQMLKDAVARLKGEDVEVEPELAIDASAFIPEEYVADNFERVALYKRLLAVGSEQELAELRDELVDRFGRFPEPVETLLKVARVRVRARKLGLLKVTLKGRRATIVDTEKSTTVPGGLDELLGYLAKPR